MFNQTTMPRKTAGKIVPRKSPSKDSNSGKLGQFTTEIAKTKSKAYLHGFIHGVKRGLSFINWTAFSIGVVIGATLVAIALS